LPVHNEQPSLAAVFEEIVNVLEDRPHEIVAVDDGSTDGSLSELHRLRSQYPSVRVLALEKRSGQSAATAAGFAAVRGDVVVTIDADGQNDPADIPTLLEALSRKPSLAAAVGYRFQRADSGWKRVQSRIANTVRNWITRDGMRDTGCSLKAIRTPILATVPRFDGMHRFLPALIQAQGGAVQQFPVRHRPRLAGQSKYGMRERAVRGLVDALAVRWYHRRALHYALKEDTN
jgi:glycosyltransferase involved in cell wall biosynthesis